jgi:hypothetical protein
MPADDGKPEERLLGVSRKLLAFIEGGDAVRRDYASVRGLGDEFKAAVAAFGRASSSSAAAARIERAAERALHERIRREGIELLGLNVEPEARCQYRVVKKEGRYNVYRPCGDPAAAVARLLAPDHPAGVRLPLCKLGLGRLTKDWVGLLMFT